MYWQDEVENDERTNVLHVFGRTSNTPHIYYYRRFIDNTLWTPWEKVPVDIEGAHLMPYVWNGRLYLFWRIVAEKPDSEKNAQLPQGSPSVTNWEIKLAWSEYKPGTPPSKAKSSPSSSYKAGNWLPKTVAPLPLVSPNIGGTQRDEPTWVSKPKGIAEGNPDVSNVEGYIHTFVSSYLPEQKSHFFRIPPPVDNLSVRVFRRY